MWVQFHELDYAERLVLATVAGIILGLPYRRRPGGVRTHMLVTLGAAYFCITAYRIAGSYDLLRVIQGITSGIGFVGAASVLKTEGRVMGVATAASIWISAAVGCEAGFGDPVLAAITAPLISATAWGVTVVELRFLRKRGLPIPPEEKVHPDDDRRE